MFGFGNSKKKACCGASEQPETRYFSTVPECPGQVPFNANGCISNKGKFYDRILHDLILPLSGQEVKGYVCEPGLWSTCQWAAICYGNNSIAILKVIGLGSDHLKMVNACQDGGEIEDNPEPGSVLKANSVIYPVPPPWCSEAFCQKVTAALENGDCACQGVLSCLQNSEEICFSTVPELADGEEVHLFGGTMLTAAGNENDDPSLWKSCLRKLKQIFTGYTGKSICFADLPETTLAPDIIDGSPVSKRQVVLDGNGCLRAGPVVTGGSCDEQLDITVADDDIHTPVDGDNGLNAKGRIFDAIKVCRNGVERVLIPSGECVGIHAVKDESNNYYWEETPLGGRMFILNIPMLLVPGDNGNLTDYAKYKRMAGNCKLYGIVSHAYSNLGTGSLSNSEWSLIVNNWHVGGAVVVGVDRAVSIQPNSIVELTTNNINVTFTQFGSGGSLTIVALRLRGYMVGASPA